jgi:hypothetical protein
MNTETIIVTGIGVIVTMIAWWCSVMWNTVRTLELGQSDTKSEHTKLHLKVMEDFVQKEDYKVTVDTILRKLEKLESIESIIANNYISRDTFDVRMRDLNGRLDQILDKLDHKADK